MAVFLESVSGAPLGELLPGKNEAKIPTFVAERHSVGEGILLRGPPHIHPQGPINPGFPSRRKTRGEGYQPSAVVVARPIGEPFW